MKLEKFSEKHNTSRGKRCYRLGYNIKSVNNRFVDIIPFNYTNYYVGGT